RRRPAARHGDDPAVADRRDGPAVHGPSEDRAGRRGRRQCDLRGDAGGPGDGVAACAGRDLGGGGPTRRHHRPGAVRALALGAGLAIAAAAGGGNDAPKAGDLLQQLTATPNTVVADGRSSSQVMLCASRDGGRDPSLAATLIATSGSWLSAPDGGARKTTFT